MSTFRDIKVTNAEDFDTMNEADSNTDEFLREFPKENVFGQSLFDSNSNLELSEKELDEMQSRLEEKFSEIMDILRIDRNDPNSMDTPRRVSKMYVRELLAGRYSKAPKLTVFPNRSGVNELVISKGIRVMSMCSHHWQPISGYCSIGYIPNKKVLGLSKLTRITDWFSRRLQIQEELGEQIADYLEDLLKPKALGVVIKSKHYCMIARGVHADEDKSNMVTSVMRGYLLEEMNIRQEFLKLIDD
ncbi:MAG: GTP cyclohydrolase I [Candidatus Kapaibacteriales bacterium]